MRCLTFLQSHCLGRPWGSSGRNIPFRDNPKPACLPGRGETRGMQRSGANRRRGTGRDGQEPALHGWDWCRFSRSCSPGPELRHSLLGQGGAQGSQETATPPFTSLRAKVKTKTTGRSSSSPPPLRLELGVHQGNNLGLGALPVRCQAMGL